LHRLAIRAAPRTILAVAVLAGSGALAAIMHAAEEMVIVVPDGVFVAAVLVGSVAFLLARATTQNAAQVGAELEATRPARIAASTEGTARAGAAPQALEHHEHHHYGPEFTSTARTAGKPPPGSSAKHSPKGNDHDLHR
jgi:hypothetical protein